MSRAAPPSNSRASASVVVGTAGHIDHGKTTLVRALTGVDTDRLIEEKKRGITIVLGFAPLDLGDGTQVGVVDVPGHEKFVRTMVAGAGGVDVGLLVVSAEEGVMPQTREHLEILKMLAVPQLVVALTRLDLVDSEMVELAELDVEELLEAVDGPWPAPVIVPTSGITGEGIEALRAALRDAVARVPAASDGDVFRMPVDRAFSIRGFGTVVTGTTRDGRVLAGESLEVLPSRKSVKIRGIQVHGEAAEVVHRGRRVAINLQGTSAEDVPPGSWLATPKALACSDRLDVAFDLLQDAPRPLVNNARVRFLYGTAELVAVVRLMDPDGGPAPDEVLPGTRGLAQLALAEACGAVPGDRFVLRVESPMLTLGGGVILDPEPPLLRRRERAAAARLLEVLADPSATPSERVLALLLRRPGEALDRDALRRRLPAGVDVAAAADGAQRARRVPTDPPSWVWIGIVERWLPILDQGIADHHSAHPLLDGPTLSEARRLLTPTPAARMFEALLPEVCASGRIEHRGHRVALAGHRPEPDGAARVALDTFVARLAAGGVHPPTIEAAGHGLDLPPDFLAWLLQSGTLIKVAEDFLVEREAFRGLVRRIVEHVQRTGLMTPGDFKELAGLSRRHAIPFLEYLDRRRLTERQGPGRVLRDIPDWV
jgi:selenocysteine-specific elongation factor